MSSTHDSASAPPELGRDGGLDAPPAGRDGEVVPIDGGPAPPPAASTSARALDSASPSDLPKVAAEGDTLDRCLIYGICQQAGLAGLFKARNLGIKAEYLSRPERQFYAMFEEFIPKGRLPTDIEIRARTGFDLDVPQDKPCDIETFGQKILVRNLRALLRDMLHPIIYEHLVKDPARAVVELAKVVEAGREYCRSLGDWPEPEPLDCDSPPPSFPLSTLPVWLRAYASSVADHHEVPVDMPAMLALAAVSGGVSKRVVGSLRGGSWIVPSNLYIMVAADSGTGKTPVLDRIMRPIRELESDLLRAATAPPVQSPPPVHWTAKPDTAEFDPLAGPTIITGVLGTNASTSSTPNTDKETTA